VKLHENHTYLAAMGSMMYLETTTCPDIAYVAGALARFGSDPGVAHCNAVKHLLCYLQGTASYTLTYNLDNTTSELFTTFSDADHGGCKDSGRSTRGYIIKMGTGAVSWSSKLQKYCCAIHPPKPNTQPHRGWKGDLLDGEIYYPKLGFKSDKPSTLQIDNQSTIQAAKNLEHHGRMKQLDLRFFWFM